MPKPKASEDRKYVTLPQALRGFVPAARHAWFYTLIGLLVGSVLFWSKHLLTPLLGEKHFALVLVEHLGISFWVAAIAVFFYEWGAHLKKTLELADKLAQLLSAKAEESLRLCLELLLGGSEEDPQIRDVASNCQALVLAISELQKERTWANDRYVSFVSSFLEKFVGQNAKSFKNLLVGGEHPFKMPKTAASVADDILAEQMQAMTGNDRYDVISDLASWKDDQMPRFQEATDNAIRRKNVKVRRVFNLLLLEEPFLDEHEKLTPAQCRAILERHLNASNDSPRRSKRPRYEVKVLRREYLTKQEPQKEAVRDAHFGVFSHGDQAVKMGVRFRVTTSDLSEMYLCRDHESIEVSRRLFAQVWEAAKPLTQDAIDEIDKELQKVLGNVSATGAVPKT